MRYAVTNVLSVVPRVSWLTGPIFDKELRVSSRRRRNYVLRTVYVAILSVFILAVWLVQVTFQRGGRSPAFQASRMAEVGKIVITTIIWFQFVAAQLIAVVMLSTAISSEIRQRTLGVLMATPVTCLQVVMGKLLSKLLQAILLLGISLPLLAVVRALGGVPWGYVISSLCITLTAVLFAGSLSLLLSIFTRQAYTVVLVVVTGYLIVFGMVPWFFGWLSPGSGTFVSQFSPFTTMLLRTYVMLSLPGMAGTFSSWPLHCGIMLCATAAVVSLTVWRVRKAALVEAFGRAASGSVRRKAKAGAGKTTAQSTLHRPLVRVAGAPVVWKEMRKPFSRRGGRWNVILYAVLAAMALLAFVPFLFVGAGAGGAFFGVASILTSVFSLLVTVRLAVLAAGSITHEKEAGTWPILLATPLDDMEILHGKAIAAFRRNLNGPAGCLAPGHAVYGHGDGRPGCPLLLVAFHDPGSCRIGRDGGVCNWRWAVLRRASEGN